MSLSEGLMLLSQGSGQLLGGFELWQNMISVNLEGSLQVLKGESELEEVGLRAEKQTLESSGQDTGSRLDHCVESGCTTD